MIMREAVRKLENNGYYVFNQFNGFFGTEENRYEMWKGDELVQDHMTEEQVIKFADKL